LGPDTFAAFALQKWNEEYKSGYWQLQRHHLLWNRKLELKHQLMKVLWKTM